MKKRMQGLIAGVIIGTMLSNGAVYAKQISETAKLFYNNIKIYIDGGEIVPKDANGNIVEPFIINGTTYLPVRAISNALGKDVEWDGATQSVYIGKKDQTKPDNYLDKIQYNDYKEGVGDTDFSIINGSITDYNNTSYTNGLLFSFGNNAGWSPIKEDKDEATIILSYPLNSQYCNLKGKIVLPKKYDISTWGKLENFSAEPIDVLLYGDNKLIYKATNVTSSLPFNIDVNVSGTNNLLLKIKTYDEYTYAALTDLALYK